MTEEILKIVASVLALLIAVIGHEIMHGWMAYRYGDNTAKKAGRLTINPIPHIDMVGSIIFPALLLILQAPFLFGWAKPVPVDIGTVLRNRGYWGAISVALAGVFYNLLLAIFTATILLSLEEPTDLWSAFIYLLLIKIVVINVVLAVFNLWPVPRFDGANALIYISLMFGTRKIYDLYMKLEPYSLVILAIILFSPLQEIFFQPTYLILQQLLFEG